MTNVMKLPVYDVTNKTHTVPNNSISPIPMNQKSVQCIWKLLATYTNTCHWYINDFKFPAHVSLERIANIVEL